MKKILTKYNTFISSDNKLTLIHNKLKSFIQYIIFNWRCNKFGKKSIIYKPDRLIGLKNVNIGNDVTILHHMRLEVITNWLGKKYDSNITIGDNVSIGQNFHVTSASNLVIEKDTTISGNVFITNIDHKYDNIGTHVLKQELEVKETYIGQNCFIGYGASIQAGTVLGKQCIVGTNAVVKGNFDDYSVIVGVPARVIKKYNKETQKWERFK